MRERLFIEEVSKTVVEGVVGIVTDRKQAVFYPECIAEVFTQLIAGDFRLPAGEIFAVEKRLPLGLWCA